MKTKKNLLLNLSTKIEKNDVVKYFCELNLSKIIFEKEEEKNWGSLFFYFIFGFSFWTFLFITFFKIDLSLFIINFGIIDFGNSYA